MRVPVGVHVRVCVCVYVRVRVCVCVCVRARQPAKRRSIQTGVLAEVKRAAGESGSQRRVRGSA